MTTPAYTDLERLGILARRLSHDMSNEMTCAVTSLALFQAGEGDAQNEEILSLRSAVDRLGVIVKHFGHMLRAESPSNSLIAGGKLAAAFATEIENYPNWTLKNLVSVSEARCLRVSTRVLRGIVEEIERSAGGTFKGFAELTVAEAAPKKPGTFLQPGPQFLMKIVGPNIHVDPSKSTLLESTEISPIVIIELVRQSGGKTTTEDKTLTLSWALS